MSLLTSTTTRMAMQCKMPPRSKLMLPGGSQLQNDRERNCSPLPNRHCAFISCNLKPPFQTPLRNFDSPGEPNLWESPSIPNELVDDFGSKRHTGYKWMQIESKKLRCTLLAFPIKIIKLIFHNLQQIAWRAAGAVGRIIIATRNIVRNDHHLLPS